MCRVLSRVFLLLLLFGGVGSLDARLRIATYNVRNYLVADRLVDGKWRKEHPKPEDEKTALREIIAKVNPDVLALQEMGTLPFLEELRRDLQLDEERHLAVLSKIPFEGVLQHNILGYKYFNEPGVVRRGLFEVQFKTGKVHWSLFTVHLKSKRTERKEDPEAAIKREKEATAVRDFLKKKHPPANNYPYILCGDFNDTPNTKPIARILKSGSNRLARYIYCRDSRNRVWTHYWRRGATYSQVDYIFASYGLLNLLPDGKRHSGHIEDSSGTLKASDHRMVYVDLPLK